MLVILFAKKFEFARFILAFEEKYKETKLKKYQVLDIITLDHIGAKLVVANQRCFLCKIIDDSDINFLLKFSTFCTVLKKYYDDELEHFRFTMVGTCGTFGDHELNKCLLVTKAFKYDRGDLTGDGKFSIRKQKVLDISMGDEGGDSIFSGNSLCSLEKNRCIALFNGIKGTEQTRLIDMETFDFFSILKYHGLNSFGAFRIVSDVCGTDNKESRLFELSFSGCIDPIFKRLHDGAIFQTSYISPKIEHHSVVFQKKRDCDGRVVFELWRGDIVPIAAKSLESLGFYLSHNLFEPNSSMPSFNGGYSNFLIQKQVEYLNEAKSAASSTAKRDEFAHRISEVKQGEISSITDVRWF